MYEFRRVCRLCVLLLVSASFVGCDSGPQTAPVSGTVSYKGEKITTGTVKFYPKEGGRPAVGSIQEDGTYELARKEPGDEVVLGDYKVTIEAKKVTGAKSAATSLADEISGDSGAPASASVKWLVPEQYSLLEKSDLTATVEDKDNQINFDIE